MGGREGERGERGREGEREGWREGGGREREGGGEGGRERGRDGGRERGKEGGRDVKEQRFSSDWLCPYSVFGIHVFAVLSQLCVARQLIPPDPLPSLHHRQQLTMHLQQDTHTTKHSH